jgi:hypothetical protein
MAAAAKMSFWFIVGFASLSMAVYARLRPGLSGRAKAARDDEIVSLLLLFGEARIMAENDGQV